MIGDIVPTCKYFMRKATFNLIWNRFRTFFWLVYNCCLYAGPKLPLWRDLVEISTRKLWHASSLLLQHTDFRNVVFEKNPPAPSEVAEVERRSKFKFHRNQKLWKFQMKFIRIRWKTKLGLSDLENDLLTSTTSEGAGYFFLKITFLKSEHQAEKY